MKTYLKSLAILAVVKSTLACGPAPVDETCALVPCAKICLDRCQQSSSSTCERLILSCQQSEADGGVDAGVGP
jgi:hypothetical protein